MRERGSVCEGRKSFVERGFAGEVCGSPGRSRRHCLNGHGKFDRIRIIVVSRMATFWRSRL